MKLYARLPDSVTVGKKKVRLDLDFRNVLRMLETLQRDDMTPEAREWCAMRCICRKPVKGALQAVRTLLFSETSQKKDDEERPKVTSFEQDAELIRAAFRQVYGINLWTERLHWLEFAELLHGLPDGNRYEEVIGIRVREIPAPTKYNAKEREWLMKAKQDVALHLTEKEAEKKYEKDVARVFRGLMSMIPPKEVNKDGE